MSEREQIALEKTCPLCGRALKILDPQKAYPDLDYHEQHDDMVHKWCARRENHQPGPQEIGNDRATRPTR
jgi:hypothetical protein